MKNGRQNSPLISKNTQLDWSHHSSLVRNIVYEKLMTLCAYGFSVNQTSFGINNYACEILRSMKRITWGFATLVASNVHRLHYVIGMHFLSTEVHVTMCSNISSAYQMVSSSRAPSLTWFIPPVRSLWCSCSMCWKLIHNCLFQRMHCIQIHKKAYRIE